MNGSIPSTRTIARLPLARSVPLHVALDRRPPLGARSVQQCSRGRSTRGHEDTAHSRIHRVTPDAGARVAKTTREFEISSSRIQHAHACQACSTRTPLRTPAHSATTVKFQGNARFIARSLSLSLSHTRSLLSRFRSSYRPTFRHALITPVCACRRRRWQFKFAGGGKGREGVSRRWRDAAASAA